MKIEMTESHVLIILVVLVATIASSIYFGIKPETFTAIATIALVIVTIFLVLANLQLVDLTKNQDKPWLHFYSEQDGSIYIKNVGKGAALNVEYTYKKNGRLESPTMTWEALSPNEKFRLDIDYPVLDSEGNYMVLTIDAMCKDINNETYIRKSIIPYHR